MDYLILFLHGVITFISPCLLPMLPIYIAYFAGQNNSEHKGKTLWNAIGFVLGFTLVFVLLGAFAGSLGKALNMYQDTVNIVLGLVVILFGLNFTGLVKIPFLNINKQIDIKFSNLGFFSSVFFGMIFSIGWTPCVGAVLGSALTLAATEGERLKGAAMLFAYSLGLGIPFILSAVLIDRLKAAFDFIKRNYRIINLVSGGLLILVGILMAAGYMGYFLSLFTF